jgi:hypothetical protein
LQNELASIIEAIEDVENGADLCPSPKLTNSFGGFDECQRAFCANDRSMRADDLAASGRIEVGYFRYIDHEPADAVFNLIEDVFTQPEKRSVVNHSAGNLDEIYAVSDL